MSAWLDSYLGRTCKNSYIYDDPFHGQLRVTPWDLNTGFGGLTDGHGTSGISRLPVFYRENDARNPRPLFGQLMKVPKWRAAYLADMRSMSKEIQWSKIGERVAALRTLVRSHLQADAKRIYLMAQFGQNLTGSVNVGFVTVPGLQPFFQGRNAFHAADVDMAKQAPTLSNLAHTPAAPKPSDTTWVRTTVSGVAAQAVTLHYRAKGPFVETAMFDDGNHQDGQANDGIYGASIPKQTAFSIVEYYASANGDLANNGAMAFLPAMASYRAASFRVLGGAPISPIVISELLAKNDTGIKDQNGEREDWIELTNIGSGPVSVSGLYLTDDSTNPTKWLIPAN